MDTKYLQRQHQTWYAVVEVPKEAREALGKRRLKKSLQTHSLPEAQRRRWAVVEEFFKAIEAVDDPNAMLLMKAARKRLQYAYADNIKTDYDDPHTGS